MVLNEGLWSLVFIVSSTLGTNWIQLKRFQVLINQTLLLNDHRILNYEYCILNMAKNSPQGKLINQKSTYLLVPIPGRTITTKKCGQGKSFKCKSILPFQICFLYSWSDEKFFWERGRDRLGAEKADFFWTIFENN